MTDRDKPANTGTVYLLHLDPPVKHARHYTGWTANLDQRLEAHRSGRGARLMEVVKEAGGTFRLVRTWPGSRSTERAIKNQKAAPKLCPECSPQPRPLARGRAADVSPHRDAVPAPEAELVPEPRPGGGPLTAWPGRPASSDVYADLLPVTDGLISGWRAELDNASPQPEPEAGLELGLLPPVSPARPVVPQSNQEGTAHGHPGQRPASRC
jgi:predicted GIY-YIG superfamily endonuclease